MILIRHSVICCAGLLLALTAPSLAQDLVSPLESPSSDDGLITIESDSQTADNVTGVVTAVGNVSLSSSLVTCHHAHRPPNTTEMPRVALRAMRQSALARVDRWLVPDGLWSRAVHRPVTFMFNSPFGT